MGRACSPASYQSNQTLLADRLAVVSLVAWAVNDRGVQVRDRVDAVRRRGRSEVALEVHAAAGRIAAFALGSQGVSGRHLLPHQHVKRALGHVSVAGKEVATVQL